MLYDAIIVGARAAGAATALCLSRLGARVLMVERAPWIGDTLSTHALMRPAIDRLADWGVLLPLLKAGTPWVHQTVFHYGTERIAVPVRADGAVQGLLAPRRSLLDPVLAEAAIYAGAELRFGAIFEDVLTDGNGRVTGAVVVSGGRRCEIRANWVIGADGRTSRVADRVAAKTLACAGSRSAALYAYWDSLDVDSYEWSYSRNLASGLIPTTGGATCVFALCPPQTYANRFGASPETALSLAVAPWAPHVAEIMARAHPCDRPRRFAGAAGHIRQAAGPGWALVGDAGYYKDPITAHGLTDAFLDAERLAYALAVHGDPAPYQFERDAHAPALFATTHRIADFDWNFDTLKALHRALAKSMKEEANGFAKPLPLAQAA